VQDADFFLLFADEKRAAEAVKRLRGLGYIAGLLATPEGHRVIASRRLSDEDFAIADEEALPELAEELDGSYEGWERTLE
jgi:Regulator of ribonuclease activity B